MNSVMVNLVPFTLGLSRPVPSFAEEGDACFMLS